MSLGSRPLNGNGICFSFCFVRGIFRTCEIVDDGNGQDWVSPGYMEFVLTGRSARKSAGVMVLIEMGRG